MTHVAVLLADGFEEIEAVTVIDVLRRAELNVQTLSLHHQHVRGAHGLELKADGLLADFSDKEWDLVVLPGGQPGSNTLRDDPRVAKLLEHQLSRKKLVGAICAAPIVLAKHGMLKNRNVTCYPGFEGQLEGALVSKEPVVVDHEITTSRGPGTALAFALSLVSQLRGHAVANELRQGMLVGV